MTHRLIARLTVRKTIHVVSTFDLYEVSPHSPVHTTTGNERRDSEFPSRPVTRKVQPALHLVRKTA